LHHIWLREKVRMRVKILNIYKKGFEK